MPNLDGVSATHLIRQFDHTPIIAMTSNIRSDDISMYFQHGKSYHANVRCKYDADQLLGMNDVLPKPFTKEGLLAMLEKHLSHLKKQPAGIDQMAAPPGPLSKASRSLKSEDSPATSPATTANWHSPNNFSGVSPAASYQADDTSLYSMPNSATTPGSYTAIQPAMQPPPMYHAPTPMAAPPRLLQAPRRGINDISGGPMEIGGDVKRQQMYATPAPPMAPQIPRPR